MASTRSPQFQQISSTLQAVVVRLYKVFGLIALVAILVGLICFLTVNLYYLFDNTWIRPVILSPEHEKVSDISGRIADHQHQHTELRAQMMELKDELQATEGKIAEHKRFESDFAASKPDDGTSIEAVMARRTLHQGRLSLTEWEARKKTISRRVTELKHNDEEFGDLLDKLKATPYYRALQGRVTVAFVPYENLENVTKDQDVYGCHWGIVICSRVGRVGATVEGEVMNSHPHNGSSLRGVMVELHLDADWAAEESALFVGSKPFWIF